MLKTRNERIDIDEIRLRYQKHTNANYGVHIYVSNEAWTSKQTGNLSVLCKI